MVEQMLPCPCKSFQRFSSSTAASSDSECATISNEIFFYEHSFDFCAFAASCGERKNWTTFVTIRHFFSQRRRLKTLRNVILQCRTSSKLLENADSVNGVCPISFGEKATREKPTTAPPKNNLIKFYGRLVSTTKSAFSRELNLYSRLQQSDIHWREAIVEQFQSF